MPELFLELFSEEIPARMQARGAEDLARLVAEALAALAPMAIRSFHGPRRIALAATVKAGIAGSSTIERGPRANASEQALAGFLRKHGASSDQLRLEGEYWVLEKTTPAAPAATVIAAAMPPLLRRFPWPKSMRWGGRSAFTWVRPLRRITCLLDGAVVPFDLREGDDDAHGLHSSNMTEGHRFHAPGAFHVESCDDWRKKLQDNAVLADAEERKRVIAEGVTLLAAEKQLFIVEDAGLLDEVAGLVEWPVPLLGRIDDTFMDLPPEVMQVSMRINQRYFAVRTPDGHAAPWFAFVANINAEDSGAAIIAGNERVLRARFADARHFWDLDRRTRLVDRVAALDGVTFHAKLGTQGERVRRLVPLAGTIARAIEPMVGTDPALAERAALLAKADLVTGMVGEFPELQGVMGRYYALHDGELPEVADAVRDHYAPKGVSDRAPSAPLAIAVALADKLDQLAGFFAIGEKPTGSGDPYALRRAALGIIRIIRENNLRLALAELARVASHEVKILLEAKAATAHTRGGAQINPHLMPASPSFFPDPQPGILLRFIVERLQIQLRAEGERHDVLAAVFAAEADDDIVRLLVRTSAVAALLGTEDGENLLTAYRRAANILRIEEKKDGRHDGEPDPALLQLREEDALNAALRHASSTISAYLADEDFAAAMSTMATLRGPLDAFFDKVTVNAPEPDIRRNRLRLLSQVRDTMNRVADFSKIES